MFIKDGFNQKYADAIKRKYAGRFNAVSKVFSNFNDEKAMKLGTLLENTEQAFSKTRSIFETTQTSNVANGLKNMYFDIITATFPGLIAEDLFSVQALDQKIGQIFYLKYIYGSDKGAIKKGDTIFGPYGDIAGYGNRNYTSETIDDETVDLTSGTNVLTGTLSYVPVIPGTVVITSDEGLVARDDGSGRLSVVSALGASLTTTSTINYATGAFSIGDATISEGGSSTTSPFTSESTVSCDYQYDLSYATSADYIPQIDVKVTDTIVQARPRKLRGTYSLDAGYDLKMSQGIDINDALLEASAMTLRHEIDGELLLTASAQAANTITWNDSYNASSSYISRKQYYEDFIDTLVKGSSMVRFATKRVEANWIVVGKGASDILHFIGAPRFVTTGDTTAAGPHFAGVLDGKWKVYVNPFFGQDDFLLGYKGSTLVDAGLVYAPYLPFFATDTIMLDDFVGRRGFATSYGKKMVNPKLYVKGTITHTGS